MKDYDYTKEDIIKALREVGLKKGDNIFIHSNIGFFGKLKDTVGSDEYYQVFKGAIFEVIGEEGTLVVPTFSYSFCNNKPFDVKVTRGIGGMLAELVRRDPDAKRSIDANFSVVAIGKNAEYFTQNAPSHSFGPDSFWERFLKKDGKFCNFNFDSGSTFIHYAEKLLNVPYRYDKTFRGKLIMDSEERDAQFIHFVYDLNNPAHAPDFTKLDRRAKELGITKQMVLGKGTVLCISAKDKLNLIKEELKKDPAFLIAGTRKDLENIVPPLERMGEEMYALIKKLYPICRSITGDGVRETLKIIKEHIPIEIKEVPSGTKVFDWTIPKEWNIKDAYIKNSKGESIVDFKKSNLHVLNYSVPINKKMNLSELKEHLFTLPKYPDWIPYLTSYYKENWGFCIPHKLYEKLEEDTYEVVIDSSLKDGHLTYGELYIKGELEDEFLFSTYICHPSLCNDNLSGVALTTFLAKALLRRKSKYSYRFLFIPETIGAITWLSLNEEKIKRIKWGFVVTCVGDSGNMTYKLSRQQDAEIDRATKKILEDSKQDYKIIDFFPPGSDERQYGSLGFKLSIGSLMRSTYDTYSEYHTSADNLDLVGARYLADSYDKYLRVIEVIENNKVYKNLYPKCEPQLGRRGVYRMIGGLKNEEDTVWAIMWLLNLCDGTNSLLDISIKSKIDFNIIKRAADALEKVEILKNVR